MGFGGMADSTIEALTKYNDEECRCKLDKVAISEGIHVAVPEPVEQVVVQPNEKIVPTPGEGAALVVILSPAVEDIPIPVPIPVEPVVGSTFRPPLFV
jgi:hypothetical protein